MKPRMKTRKVQRHRSLFTKAGVIRILSVTGFVTTDGTWYIRLSDGDTTIGFEEQPNPLAPEIEHLLHDHERGSKTGVIDHLVISPIAAARLYLEGKLTEADATCASVGFRSVRFYSIRFETVRGSYMLDLEVQHGAEHSCVAVDGEDQIVHIR